MSEDAIKVEGELSSRKLVFSR